MNVRQPSLSQLNRDARLLIAASGIFAVGFFGIQMLLKVLYILRLGHGPRYVGRFTAAGAFTYMGMSLPSGVLGRRLGMRMTLLLGGIVTVMGMISLPLTESVSPWARGFWPIVSQIVLTAGWSMLSVNLVPALTAATTKRNRNNAYALSNALMGLGAFLGTVFGGILPGLFADALHQSLNMPDPYRSGLWVGAGLASLGLIPLSLIGPVGPVVSRQQAGAQGAFPVFPVALMVVYVCLRHAGWATCQVFCNAYMDTDLNLLTSSIGLITGVGQFVAVFASLLTPRLAAHHSNGWVLMTSTLATTIGLMLLGLIPHWAAAAVAQLCILVMSAVWMPALQAFQMDLVDSQWRSLAYASVSVAMGLGFGSVSLLGGYVVVAAGYRTVFLVGVILSTVSAALMWVMLRSRSKRAGQPDSSSGASRN